MAGKCRYVQSSLRSGTEELMNVLRQEQFVDVSAQLAINHVS